MPTMLPRDAHNNPIPALRLKSGGAHSISTSSSSARNASAFAASTNVVSLYADVPVYIKFGGDSVTAAATDHYFPAGVYYDFAIGSEETGQFTHVAVLSADSDGTLYVSEKE